MAAALVQLGLLWRCLGSCKDLQWDTTTVQKSSIESFGAPHTSRKEAHMIPERKAIEDFCRRYGQGQHHPRPHPRPHPHPPSPPPGPDSSQLYCLAAAPGASNTSQGCQWFPASSSGSSCPARSSPEGGDKQGCLRRSELLKCIGGYCDPVYYNCPARSSEPNCQVGDEPFE